MSRPRLVLSPPSPPSSLSTPEAPTRHRVVKRYYVGPLPTYALGFYKSPSHSRTSSHRAWYYFLTSSSSSPSGYSSVRTYQPTSQSNCNNHFNSSNSNGNANSTQCFRRRFGTKLGFMTSSSRSNNQSNNRHRSQNEAANVTAMTTSSIGNDHAAQLSNEHISNALRESSTTSSSGSSSSTNDDQSNVQTPLLIGRKHHTTAPSTPSHRIRDPIAPHTPVDSIKRIDSSIHPLPKLSTPIMRQQRPSAVSTSVSAPPTVPGTTTMTSPNTNEMSQHNIKVGSSIATITDIIASDITPTAESLCHLMLLRVERVHPHNMPDVYHQGVAIFTSLRSVQWRQVVGQLDGAHLSFHQPSSPSSSVPGKVLYSLELAHYQQLKLSFFSPLDNSLALSLVSQYKEDMVEVFIFQLKEDHLLQQWYSRLEKLIEQRLSWQDQLLAGRDPCQLLQRPTLAVANAAMSNRLSISSGGLTSYRQHSPRERTTKRRSKRHSKLRGRHSMEKGKARASELLDSAQASTTNTARDIDPSLQRPLSLMDRHITLGMLPSTSSGHEDGKHKRTSLHRDDNHKADTLDRPTSSHQQDKKRTSGNDQLHRINHHENNSHVNTRGPMTISAAVSQMAATGIAPMVALATPAPTSTHRAQPSQISIDDSQAKEITSLGKQNVLASHRPIELTVEIPDIGSRVRVDLSGYDSTTLLSYSRLRTLVLDVLMGRRVIDTPGDTPDEAMERRKQLATLWQYWNEGEVGLVWRRWHRLEWPHPESSISMSRILERTHTLELRRTSHYGRFIDTTISPIRPINPIVNSTPTDRLRVPPPDVEGCLLRVFKIKHALATFMTRQRKHANTRRFYLATRGRFLFITTPTRLPLPKFTSTNYNENSVLVRELKDPTNSSDDSGTSAKQPALPRLAGALIDLVNMVRVNVVSPSAEEEDNQFSHHMLPNRSIPLDNTDNHEAQREGLPQDATSSSAIHTDHVNTRHNNGNIVNRHRQRMRLLQQQRVEQQRRQRRVEIVFRNGYTLRLLATDERSALEWQRRLQAIAQYWRQYHEYEQKLRKMASIAAGAFTHQRQQLDNHDHRPHNGWSKECYSQQENHLPATREIGRSEDYETGSIMVDTQLWPICTSLGCESIVQAGVLYRRTGRRQPAHRLFCILTNDGYLCYFDAASPSSSVASMQNRNNSSTSIQLARGRTRLHQAYIYSRCRDREINTGRARMAKLERPTSRYIGDGLYTRDSLLDCSFALWLPSRHQYFWHTNGQRGHAITFRAMDRLSTEAWVMAIQTVIDRLQSTTSNSTANDSNVTAPSTEETNLSSTSHLHDISNDSIGLQHQQQHGDDTFANLANNSTISLHD